MFRDGAFGGGEGEGDGAEAVAEAGVEVEAEAEAAVAARNLAETKPYAIKSNVSVSLASRASWAHCNKSTFQSLMGERANRGTRQRRWKEVEGDDKRTVSKLRVKNG